MGVEDRSQARSRGGRRASWSARREHEDRHPGHDTRKVGSRASPPARVKFGRHVFSWWFGVTHCRSRALTRPGPGLKYLSIRRPPQAIENGESLDTCNVCHSRSRSPHWSGTGQVGRSRECLSLRTLARAAPGQGPLRPSVHPGEVCRALTASAAGASTRAPARPVPPRRAGPPPPRAG